MMQAETGHTRRHNHLPTVANVRPAVAKVVVAGNLDVADVAHQSAALALHLQARVRNRDDRTG